MIEIVLLSLFFRHVLKLPCLQQSMLTDLYFTKALLHHSVPCVCDILRLSIGVCQRVVKLISGITKNGCCVCHCKPLCAQINGEGNAPVCTLFPQVCVRVCVCLSVGLHIPLANKLQWFPKDQGFPLTVMTYFISLINQSQTSRFHTVSWSFRCITQIHALQWIQC